MRPVGRGGILISEGSKIIKSQVTHSLFLILFTYLFMTALGLHGCEPGPLPSCRARASDCGGFFDCGAQA